jgi:mono/diheme cytochrome c family protein
MKENLHMNNKKLGLISFCLVLLVLTIILSACATTTSTPTSSSSSTAAPLDGKALMQQRCSVCHSTTRITQMNGTAAQWTSVVDRMINKGAQINASERQTLIEYLSQTYP